MRSPGRSVRSQKKMPTPVRESTCPAMTAAPTAPGRGPPVNQPATVVVAGTCSVPLVVMPRSMSEVLIPSAGTLSQVGLAGTAAVAIEAGSTVAPDGAGMGFGLTGIGTVAAGDRAATATPAVPTHMATSPAP